jgi:hypothetical protein
MKRFMKNRGICKDDDVQMNALYQQSLNDLSSIFVHCVCKMMG